MRSVATARAPVPICRPEGSVVCCDDWEPGWRTFWYSRSSNTARERLKPLVLTLARLLVMTSRLVCCASRPVLAMNRERIMSFSSNAADEHRHPQPDYGLERINSKQGSG